MLTNIVKIWFFVPFVTPIQPFSLILRILRLFQFCYIIITETFSIFLSWTTETTNSFHISNITRTSFHQRFTLYIAKVGYRPTNDNPLIALLISNIKLSRFFNAAFRWGVLNSTYFSFLRLFSPKTGLSVWATISLRSLSKYIFIFCS